MKGRQRSRRLLVLTYFIDVMTSLAQTPGPISIERIGSNEVQVSWTALSDTGYVLRTTANLSESWETADSIFLGSSGVIVQRFSANSDVRFFQIGTCCTPVIRSDWPGFTRAFAYGIDATSNHVYIAASSAGLQIIDVTTPARPRWVGGMPLGSSAWDVRVRGD